MLAADETATVLPNIGRKQKNQESHNAVTCYDEMIKSRMFSRIPRNVSYKKGGALRDDKKTIDQT